MGQGRLDSSPASSDTPQNAPITTTYVTEMCRKLLNNRIGRLPTLLRNKDRKLRPYIRGNAIRVVSKGAQHGKVQSKASFVSGQDRQREGRRQPRRRDRSDGGPYRPAAHVAAGGNRRAGR